MRPVSFFDFVARFYDPLVAFSFLGKEAQIRSQVSALIPRSALRLVELGCGTGSLLWHVQRKHAFLEMYGVDYSPRMLRRAAEKLEGRVVLKKADIRRTGLQSSFFDVVLISLVLHEFSIQEAQAVLKEAKRLLKKGGLLIILDMHAPSSRIMGFLQALENFLFEKYARQFIKQDLVKWLGALKFKEPKKRIYFGGAMQLVWSRK